MCVVFISITVLHDGDREATVVADSGCASRLTSLRICREGKIETHLPLCILCTTMYVEIQEVLSYGQPTFVAQEKRLVCQGDSRAGEGQSTDSQWFDVRTS